MIIFLKTWFEKFLGFRIDVRPKIFVRFPFFSEHGAVFILVPVTVQKFFVKFSLLLHLESEKIIVNGLREIEKIS